MVFYSFNNIFSSFFNLRQKDPSIFKSKYILKEIIEEEDKFVKYFLNLLMLLGSSGFLIVGISSYLQFNIISFLNATNIVFFPQGLIMSFYGTLGLVLTVNQILILFWGVGEGYNEFDKLKGILTIYRKGFPGKNLDICINYSLNDIVRLMMYKKEYFLRF